MPSAIWSGKTLPARSNTCFGGFTVTNLVPIGRALISVSDKTGLIDLARALAGMGVELISTGGTSGLLDFAGPGHLNEVHQLAVVGKNRFKQSRVPINPQAAYHQPIKVLEQKIGQIKRTQFTLIERLKSRTASKELVTMGARDSLHTLFEQHRIEQTTGAAVCVGDKNTGIGRSVQRNFFFHRSGDFFGSVVQFSGQALDVHVRPVIEPSQSDDLPGQRPASNDQRT